MEITLNLSPSEFKKLVLLQAYLESFAGTRVESERALLTCLHFTFIKYLEYAEQQTGREWLNSHRRNANDLQERKGDFLGDEQGNGKDFQGESPFKPTYMQDGERNASQN